MRAPAPYHATAKFFFALGHQRRLTIIKVLISSPDPLTYEQIEIKARMSQGALTHHLRILTEAGFIHRKIRNRNSFYHPNRALIADLPQLNRHVSALKAA